MRLSPASPASAVNSDARLPPPPSAHSRPPRSRSPLHQIRRLFHRDNRSTTAAEENNGTKTRQAERLKPARSCSPSEPSRPWPKYGSLSVVADRTLKTGGDLTEPWHPQRPDDTPPATDNGWYRLSAAYREALDSFDKRTVQAIQQADSMGDLIKNLDRKRDELNQKSWFLRGLHLLHEPLRKLDPLLPLGKAFASIDPTAATALGIVEAVIGVRVPSFSASPRLCLARWTSFRRQSGGSLTNCGRSLAALVVPWRPSRTMSSK